MKIATIDWLYRNVIGINQRNLKYIYPSNPRKFFPLANDKSITKKILSQAHIPVPPTYFIISKMVEINSCWDDLSVLPDWVIKPAKGRAGGGILVLKRENKTAWVTPSGKVYIDREIKKHIADILFGIYSFGLGDKTIIEYRVNSHPLIADIFPQGVADIRVLMYNHHPCMAMMRIPTSQSGGRANLHQGAIGISIDLNSGVLGKGYNRLGYFSHHPDSGVKFIGLNIPDWTAIVKLCIQTSQQIPLKYLGVDVVIDKFKGPLIMEINARPGLEIQNVTQQGLRPVLEKETVDEKLF